MDAQYGLVRNTVEAVEWLNQTMVECISWQEDPAIYHDEVKLTGNLGIFYPNWSNEIELPNHASASQIATVCKLGIEKYLSK